MGESLTEQYRVEDEGLWVVGYSDVEHQAFTTDLNTRLRTL